MENQQQNILFTDNKIEVQEIYKINGSNSSYGYLSKFYILTNVGIFIATEIEKNFSLSSSSDNLDKKKKYCLTDFFLETTPGRLIFSINFKKAINSQ